MHTPNEITIAHQIAFLYLYFASETDKQLASEEMKIISDKIENCLNKNINEGNSLNAWDIVSESLNWFTSLNPIQKEENYIKIMDYFFTENLSDDERWNFIENYFLGKNVEEEIN